MDYLAAALYPQQSEYTGGVFETRVIKTFKWPIDAWNKAFNKGKHTARKGSWRMKF